MTNTDEGGRNARTFIDALYKLEQEGDVDTIASLYADDAETSNPSDWRTPHRGADGARTFWRAYRDAFQMVHSEFRNIVEAGETAILEWSSTARMAHGQNVVYPGTSVIEFAGGKVRRFRAYFDPNDLVERPDPSGNVGG